MHYIQTSASPRRNIRRNLDGSRSMNASGINLEKSMSLERSTSFNRSATMIRNVSLPALKKRPLNIQGEVTEFSAANQKKLLQKSVALIQEDSAMNIQVGLENNEVQLLKLEDDADQDAPFVRDDSPSGNQGFTQFCSKTEKKNGSI